MEDGSRNKEVLLTGNVGIANAENLLGIIGVVNRSKEETDQNKTIAEALRSEKKFFETNYSVIGSRNGTPFLVKTLCDVSP
jgi:hypothetical protein